MSKMIGITIVGLAALACAAGAIAGHPNGNVGRGLRSCSRCRGSGHRSSRRGGLGDRARARGPAARGATRRRHDAGRRPARMEAAPSRGPGLAWKPAEAGSSRHLPDRGAGRGRATGRAVGELDAPCLRSGDPFPALVRQARRRGEMVGADRHRPCSVDRAQTLAPARLRPARSAAPPTARGRLLAGRTPRRRGSPRHVRHCRPQRLRRPLAPARSDVAALSKSLLRGMGHSGRHDRLLDGTPKGGAAPLS